MSTNPGGLRLMAEKRHALSQATHTKAIRGAIHDVGIVLGLLFTVDKVVEIWSRSWKIALGFLGIAAVFFLYLIIIRT